MAHLLTEREIDYQEQYWSGVYRQFSFKQEVSPIPEFLCDHPDWIQTFYADWTLIYVHPEFHFRHIVRLFRTARIDTIVAVLLTETRDFKNLHEQNGWLLVESSHQAPSDEATWTAMHQQFRKMGSRGMTLATYAAFAVACRDSSSYPDKNQLIGIPGTTWKGRSIVAGFPDGKLTLELKERRSIKIGRSAVSISGVINDPSGTQLPLLS